MQPDIDAHLKLYQGLLHKWQKSINLVSNATINESWERHFLDSTQLEPLVTHDAKTLIDLGSGAGFPGMVLAIQRPELNVHLVESDQRKCSFLRSVSRETKVPVTIHNERIEQINGADNLKPDVVTARALASLKDLLDYCIDWAEENEDLILVFMKGENAASELDEARTVYSFDVKEHQSVTSRHSAILELRSLQRICA